MNERDPPVKATKRPKTSSEGVEVLTWGSVVGETGGATKIPGLLMHGGNVGHASILLSLKYTQTNIEMVAKYCDEAKIPYSTVLTSVPSIVYTERPYDGPELESDDPSSLETNEAYQAYKKQLLENNQRIAINAKGERVIVSQAINENRPAHQEELIQVYFSWWPSEYEDVNFELCTLEQDHYQERLGRPVEYTDSTAAYLEPEYRMLSGLLGRMSTQKIALGPKSTLHTASLSNEAAKAFELRQRLEQGKDRLKLIKKTLDKIDFTKEKTGVSKNTAMMLEFILGDDITPYWQSPRQNVLQNLEALEADIQSELEQAEAALTEQTTAYFTVLSELNHAKHVPKSHYESETKTYLKLAAKQQNPSVNEDSKSITPLLRRYKKRFPMTLGAILEDINQNKQVKKKYKTLYRALSAYIESQDASELSVDTTTAREAILTGLALATKKKMIDYQNKHVDAIKNDLEAHVLANQINKVLVTHQPPDNIIQLPLKTSKRDGVNPKALLKAMRNYVQNPENVFDLATNNCSIATSTVLSQSTGELGERIFSTHELGGSTMSPQMMVTRTAAYLETVINPNHGIERVDESAYVKMRNKIAKFALDSLNQAYEPKTSSDRFKGIMKLLALLPVLAFIVIKEAIVPSESGYKQVEKQEHLPPLANKLVKKLGGADTKEADLVSSPRDKMNDENLEQEKSTFELFEGYHKKGRSADESDQVALDQPNINQKKTGRNR